MAKLLSICFQVLFYIGLFFPLQHNPNLESYKSSYRHCKIPKWKVFRLDSGPNNVLNCYSHTIHCTLAISQISQENISCKITTFKLRISLKDVQRSQWSVVLIWSEYEIHFLIINSRSLKHLPVNSKYNVQSSLNHWPQTQRCFWSELCSFFSGCTHILGVLPNKYTQMLQINNLN